MDIKVLEKQAALSQAEAKMVNEHVFERLSSGNPTLIKEATDAVTDFTRMKMREDGFARQILPIMPITNDQLVRQIETDKLVFLVDREPDSPAAVSVPFATLPTSLWIRGERYPVFLERIMTSRFTKDTDELRTWIMDIRQVLSDNSIKDMLAEEDGKLLAAANAGMVGAGATVAASGVIQHRNFGGSITRDGLVDMLKIMPSTPSHLEVKITLCNNITIKDVMKFGRTELGGDLAQDILRSGFSEQELFGTRLIVTIKTDLVPTGTFFHWADPKFTGKFVSLEDTVMYIRREAFMLEFFAYETNGCTIGNLNALSRVNFL